MTWLPPLRSRSCAGTHIASESAGRPALGDRDDGNGQGTRRTDQPVSRFPIFCLLESPARQSPTVRKAAKGTDFNSGLKWHRPNIGLTSYGVEGTNHTQSHR